MKKKLLLSLMGLVFSAGIAEAQSPTMSAGDLTGGLKAGVSRATLAQSFTGAGSAGSLESRTGLIFGGFARKAITDTFAVQPEVMFSRQGASLLEDGIAINYLQVPVLGVAMFPGDVAQPFLFGGPALSLKLSANTISRGVSTEAKDVSGSDFGLIVGGGVEIERLVVEVRYNWGLKNIATDSLVKEKNRVFSLLVGYRFR